MVTLAALATPALLMRRVAFDVTAVVELALGLAGAGARTGSSASSSPATRCLGELRRLIDSAAWCRGCCHVAWRG